MIVGMGSDLVDIRRIELSLLRFGKRFEQRVFTEAEQKYAHKGPDDIHAVASSYAKRFAAKEACMKAMNSGRGNAVSWLDIEVVHSVSGMPGVRITGKAFKRLQEIMPAGMKPQVFLSLSDEYPYAQAQVIISAVPL